MMTEVQGPVAIVEWILGDRKVSEFMSRAGLGITGAGVKERAVLTYHPGEVVDEARVMRALESMARQADEERAEFVILCPRVVSITQ